MVKQVLPNIVYTHSESDLNIDHLTVNRAVLTTFRPLPEAILERLLTFEIPSSFEYASYASKFKFVPNYFVELDSNVYELKITALKCYEDELCNYPHPRSLEYINALTKVKSAAVGLSLCEYFFCERMIVRN